MFHFLEINPQHYRDKGTQCFRHLPILSSMVLSPRLSAPGLDQPICHVISAWDKSVACSQIPTLLLLSHLQPASEVRSASPFDCKPRFALQNNLAYGTLSGFVICRIVGNAGVTWMQDTGFLRPNQNIGYSSLRNPGSQDVNMMKWTAYLETTVHLYLHHSMFAFEFKMWFFF